MKTPKIGDKVMYSRAFLRSCGIYTGKMPFLVGEVIGKDVGEVSGADYRRIRWEDGRHSTDRTTNLVLRDERHLEPV